MLWCTCHRPQCQSLFAFFYEFTLPLCVSHEWNCYYLWTLYWKLYSNVQQHFVWQYVWENTIYPHCPQQYGDVLAKFRITSESRRPVDRTKQNPVTNQKQYLYVISHHTSVVASLRNKYFESFQEISLLRKKWFLHTLPSKLAQTSRSTHVRNHLLYIRFFSQVSFLQRWCDWLYRIYSCSTKIQLFFILVHSNYTVQGSHISSERPQAAVWPHVFFQTKHSSTVG